MSGFKNPKDIGEDTLIFDEKYAYSIISGYNKMLIDKGISEEKEVKQIEAPKKSGFCQ